MLNCKTLIPHLELLHENRIPDMGLLDQRAGTSLRLLITYLKLHTRLRSRTEEGTSSDREAAGL